MAFDSAIVHYRGFIIIITIEHGDCQNVWKTLQSSVNDNSALLPMPEFLELRRDDETLLLESSE